MPQNKLNRSTCQFDDTMMQPAARGIFRPIQAKHEVKPSPYAWLTAYLPTGFPDIHVQSNVSGADVVCQQTGFHMPGF
eukprot:1161808-Pelagomonas_calceolata.AAC.7